MDKLYWIVCEESDSTLFEGKYQGRTRGAAIKFLKEQIGRSQLTGLVYTVTEIPVPLIEEIVRCYLKKLGISIPQSGDESPSQVVPFENEAEPDEGQATDPDEAEDNDPPPSGAELRRKYDWNAIKECYMNGNGPKDVAEMMDVPLNALKGKIHREGWAKERRAQA